MAGEQAYETRAKGRDDMDIDAMEKQLAEARGEQPSDYHEPDEEQNDGYRQWLQEELDWVGAKGKGKGGKTGGKTGKGKGSDTVCNYCTKSGDFRKDCRKLEADKKEWDAQRIKDGRPPYVPPAWSGPKRGTNSLDVEDDYEAIGIMEEEGCNTCDIEEHCGEDQREDYVPYVTHEMMNEWYESEGKYEASIDMLSDSDGSDGGFRIKPTGKTSGARSTSTASRKVVTDSAWSSWTSAAPASWGTQLEPAGASGSKSRGENVTDQVNRAVEAMKRQLLEQQQQQHTSITSSSCSAAPSMVFLEEQVRCGFKASRASRHALRWQQRRGRLGIYLHGACHHQTGKRTSRRRRRL